MKNNLKIAMISCFSDPLAPVGGRQAGGASIYIYELAKSLSNLGVNVDVYCRWDNRRAERTARIAKSAKLIRLKAGPRHFIPQEQYATYLPEFIENFLKYTREKKLKYDILHSHQYASGLIGLRMKYICKLPLVHTFHSLGQVKLQATKDTGKGESEGRFLVEQKIISNADAIVATSPQEKINIINMYDQKADNITVIPAGVNVKRFTPIPKSQARKSLGLDQNSKIIVFAARMDENKGLLELVEAVQKIKSYNPKLYNNLKVYAFAGDPRKERRKEKVEESFRKRVYREIADRKIKDHFFLSHAIDQEKLHKYYSASNLVAMPTYYESFGLVAIEAMSSGAPVVASDVGGLKWTVHNNLTGFRVPPKNPTELYKKMVKILTDENLEKRLSENAVILAHEDFNWQTISKKIEKVYNDLVGSEKEVL